jgi:hypothetical protein
MKSKILRGILESSEVILANLPLARAALTISHISAYSGKSYSTISPASSTKLVIPRLLAKDFFQS